MEALTALMDVIYNLLLGVGLGYLLHIYLPGHP